MKFLSNSYLFLVLAVVSIVPEVGASSEVESFSKSNGEKRLLLLRDRFVAKKKKYIEGERNRLAALGQCMPSQEQVANLFAGTAFALNNEAHFCRAIYLGAQVNITEPAGKWGLVEESGWTPLHVAAKQGAVKAVLGLLAAGADSTAVDAEGNTALHCGAQEKYATVVRLLLLLGSPVNVTNNRHQTPLHMAVIFNQRSAKQTEEGLKHPDCLNIVQDLLASGADVTIADDAQNLPIFFAQQLPFPEENKAPLVQLLELAYLNQASRGLVVPSLVCLARATILTLLKELKWREAFKEIYSWVDRKKAPGQADLFSVEQMPEELPDEEPNRLQEAV